MYDTVLYVVYICIFGVIGMMDWVGMKRVLIYKATVFKSNNDNSRCILQRTDVGRCSLSFPFSGILLNTELYMSSNQILFCVEVLKISCGATPASAVCLQLAWKVFMTSTPQWLEAVESADHDEPEANC